MENLEEAITVSKKGKRELRSLVARGKFAIIEYLDPETRKRTEDKVKLVLARDDGKVEEYFLIPTATPSRSLNIKYIAKGEGICPHCQAYHGEKSPQAYYSHKIPSGDLLTLHHNHLLHGKTKTYKLYLKWYFRKIFFQKEGAVKEKLLSAKSLFYSKKVHL